MEQVRAAAAPLRGADDDYNSLLELVGDARLVLLGEASHGTHEFYRERARITRRLIEEKGFTAVAVEPYSGRPIRALVALPPSDGGPRRLQGPEASKDAFEGRG